MSKNLVIGLTGSFGSGCGETATYLKDKKGFKVYSLTTLIREEAKSKGKDNPDRNNLQNIGDDLRKNNKPDFLVRKIFKKIDWNGSDSIVIKSIRNHHEALFFKRNLINFYLINIDAPKSIRYQRVISDYTRPEDFDKEDERDSGDDQPFYGQQVKKCVDLSDIIINNTEKKKDLYSKIEYYLGIISEPGSKLPTEMEINMAQAHFWSLKSTCLSRKVGAVIIKQGHTIASGYNDTPTRIVEVDNKIKVIKIPSCGELWNYCYRDIYKRCMNKECKALITYGLHNCPECGKLVEKDQREAIGKHLDLCRAIHAEERAIMQVAKLGGQSLKDSTIYTTTFPCQLCAKKIIESGITKVLYVDPYPYAEAMNLLQKAEIELEKFQGVKSKKFDILYSKII